MCGTKDNLHEMIEIIESQGFDFVLGILKPNDKNEQQIEIFTNGSSDGLKKLLFVLKEHQKSVKVKKEIREITSE